MIRLLLRALEWLDRRFPPKVTITREALEKLEEKVHRNSKAFDAVKDENLELGARLSAAEKSISALKDGISTGKIATGAVKDRLRDEFVRGEGEAWSGRPQTSPVVPAGV